MIVFTFYTFYGRRKQFYIRRCGCFPARGLLLPRIQTTAVYNYTTTHVGVVANKVTWLGRGARSKEAENSCIHTYKQLRTQSHWGVSTRSHVSHMSKVTCKSHVQVAQVYS